MTVRYICYDATGRTAQEIRAAMNANPARPVDQGDKVDAFTRWESRLNWSYSGAGGTCTATSVAPTLEITFTFPRWVPPPSPSPGTIQQWGTYLDALQLHEAGHQQNGIDATSDAVGRVKAVRTASCAEFNAAASQVMQAALKLGNDADIRYDAATRHGATQGAVFP